MLTPIKFLKYSFLVYILIIIIYYLGPIDFPPLSTKVFFFSILGYLVIWLGIHSNSSKKYLYISKKSVASNTEFLFLILALASILFNLIKYYNEGILFSGIDVIISNRLEKSFSNSEKGTSIFGVFGNLLNGFVFVYFAYSKWKNNSLAKNERLPLILFVFSALITILGGGRFGVIIHLIFYFLVIKLLNIKKPVTFSINNNFSTLSLFFIVSAFIIYTFIIKLQIHDINLSAAFSISTGFEIKSTYLFLFGDYLSGLISIIFYYISHSIYEFNFFLDNFNGEIQLGAYQFYTFSMFLNKFFFADIITIEEILSALPKSGVYSTAFSSMIIDFGYYFSFLILYLIGFLFSSSYYNFNKRNSFLGFFIYIMLSINILFIPILSLIGTSIFPSIILSTIVYSCLSLISK